MPVSQPRTTTCKTGCVIVDLDSFDVTCLVTSQSYAALHTLFFMDNNIIRSFKAMTSKICRNHVNCSELIANDTRQVQFTSA